ncbi:MAG: hypothetical protein CVV45_21275, partial [Spirochaetae bacterium HGW-Spirochaetae-10]
HLTPQLTEKKSELDLTVSEIERLKKDKTDRTAAAALLPAGDEKDALLSQIDDLDERIGILESRRTALEPVVTELEDEFRELNSIGAEVQRSGSSSSLMASVREKLATDSVSFQMLRYSLVLMDRPEVQTETGDGTPAEQVKAIIGFLETEADGSIRRDANGKGIVAADYRTLTLDPDADIRMLLGSSRTGEELREWARRLRNHLADADKAAKLAPEVRASVELLQNSILDYEAALLFIEKRDATQSELLALAGEMQNGGREKQEKLALVLSLENQVRSAIENATAHETDPVDAALAVLESPENARILSIFSGYDKEGEADSVIDEETGRRLMELATLAESLRSARLDRQ